MSNKYRNKVVIGTWSLSGDYGPVKDLKVKSILDKCIKYNFKEFDTAPTYGKGVINEILNEFIQKKQKIKINTKCGYNKNFVKTFNTKDIISSVDESLKLFKKINILFLHNPRDEIKNWKVLISILKDYKKRNLINHIGISFARDCYFEKKILKNFDYFQDEVNLLKPGNIQYLKNFSANLMARSPLASGCLSGRLDINSKFGKNDHRSGWLNDKKRLKNILYQLNEIKKIISGNLRKKSKIFLLQNKNIHKVIFGVKNILHVDELNKDLSNIKKIENYQIEQIYKLSKNNYYLSKNQQGY